METITDRVKNLISHKTTAAKRFKELEDLTKIPSGTWRTWWNKESRPSGEMIEAIGQIWPEYAFWLITGIQDSEYGHLRPTDTDDMELVDLTKFTSREDAVKQLNLLKLLKDATRKVFTTQLKMRELSYQYKHDHLIDSETYQWKMHDLYLSIEMALAIRNQHQISYAKMKDAIEQKLTKSTDEYHKFLMWNLRRAKDIALSTEEKELQKTREEFKAIKYSPSDDIPI
ncbi:hypothetical protein Undi14_07910 [Undibacterium sp. 14-3-2]|uniref:hypothetical protein n=1 Tax=Undibacterium sp. 14-3-2 TaxID=2800129 RepID=UPI001904DF18|nr:hypothetical protein [Undibacterium sp. 14-3-2]MBK1889960.1 hypothetical protein [Undibacterium sp. 14-3-2]